MPDDSFRRETFEASTKKAYDLTLDLWDLARDLREEGDYLRMLASDLEKLSSKIKPAVYDKTA